MLQARYRLEDIQTTPSYNPDKGSAFGQRTK